MKFESEAPHPYRAILVPLDGSEHAERALPAAMVLLQRAGSKPGPASEPPHEPPHPTRILHLVSVVEPMSFFLPGDPTLSVPPPEWFEAEADRVKQFLERVRSELEQGARASTPAHPIKIVCHTPRGGPATEVLRVAQAEAVDLIVLGSQGKGSMARAWLGSVADRVVREAPCPVLVVPPGVADLDLSSIMVPLDGSEASDTALREAMRLADHAGGRLNLVTVVPRPHSMAVPYVDLSAETERYRMQIEDAQRAHLDIRGNTLLAKGYQVETKTLRADEVAPGLVRLVGQMRAGLVVMSTSGRGGLARAVLGSVATRMLRLTPVPVLLVSPGVNPKQ